MTELIGPFTHTDFYLMGELKKSNKYLMDRDSIRYSVGINKQKEILKTMFGRRFEYE